jgi:putative peptidoglycan lipid II flippase
MTAHAFFFYSIGMVFIALKEFLNRCFVALKETKPTMTSSVLAVAVNIILSIFLSRYMGVGGIALAASVAMALQTALLFYRLPAAVMIEKAEMVAFSKAFAKQLCLFFFVYALSQLIAIFLPASNSILHLMILSVMALGLFAAGSIIFKCQEVFELKKMIKLRRKD